MVTQYDDKSSVNYFATKKGKEKINIKIKFNTQN